MREEINKWFEARNRETKQFQSKRDSFRLQKEVKERAGYGCLRDDQGNTGG